MEQPIKIRLTGNEADWAAIALKDLAENRPAFGIGDIVEFQHFVSEETCRGIILGMNYTTDFEAPTTENGRHPRGWEYTVQPLEDPIDPDDLCEDVCWEGRLTIIQKYQGA